MRTSPKRVDERQRAMSKDKALREQLLYLLGGGGAHVDFETVIKDFPPEIINRRAEHMPLSARLGGGEIFPN